MADYNKLLQVPRGTKARLEQIKLDLLVNTLVYATDTKELGIKLINGNIEYFMNATDINARVDTLETANAYFIYAASIYGAKYSLFSNAWEHSLTVYPLWISVNSSISSPQGKEQYPNGETEGVIIPQGVTSIGEYAFFSWSSNNKPLVIPDSVTSIGIGAFSGWSSNNKPLVIPDSVTSIGNSAFGYWSLVPYVEIQAITPPTLVSGSAFEGQGDAPIYVPDESVDDYKAATNWVSLADRIFPVSDMPNVNVLSDRVDNLETSKQDKLVAGDNITIDEITNVISASGEGLLPKSGGTLENYNEKLTTLSTSSGAINLSLSSVFVQTPAGNITYAINNAVAGVAHSFTLIINMEATVRTLTFPAIVKWQGGEIPDMTTPSKTYVLTFVTVTGGTTWLGMFGGEF